MKKTNQEAKIIQIHQSTCKSALVALFENLRQLDDDLEMILNSKKFGQEKKNENKKY